MHYIAKELREKRAGIVSAAYALINNKDVAKDDLPQFDRMMAEADEIKAHYERIEHAAAAEAEMAEIIGAKAERNGFSRDHQMDKAQRGKLGFLASIRELGGAVLSSKDRELVQEYRATQSVGSPTGGGNLVDVTLMHELYVAMKAQGGMRSVATIIKTQTGGTYNAPVVDDRANVASIVAENASRGTSADMAFNLKPLGAWTYTSGVATCSIESLQDTSGFDLEGFIKSALTDRFTRGTNAHYTVGTGSGQPRGVSIDAASGRVGNNGQTTSIVYSDLVKTFHAIDPVYRKNMAWMMNDASVAVIRQLVDSTGQPIWQSGMQAGAPDRLLGLPIVINQDMPVMAANAKSILAGDFSTYVIRDVLDVSFAVLRERYIDVGQVGFVANMRTDGRLVTAASPVVYYQNSAT